jgi:hypothetical protein
VLSFVVQVARSVTSEVAVSLCAANVGMRSLTTCAAANNRDLSSELPLNRKRMYGSAEFMPASRSEEGCEGRNFGISVYEPLRACEAFAACSMYLATSRSNESFVVGLMLGKRGVKER